VNGEASALRGRGLTGAQRAALFHPTIVSVTCIAAVAEFIIAVDARSQLYAGPRMTAYWHHVCRPRRRYHRHQDVASAADDASAGERRQLERLLASDMD
jgi:hypothetical protein